MNGATDAAARVWPKLDYPVERDTYETCHRIGQLIGKLPLRLLPWMNHGWHVALRVTPHGYVTRTMPADPTPGAVAGSPVRFFCVELDVREEVIRIACDDGAIFTTDVPGKSVAQLQVDLTRLLLDAGLPAPLDGGPNEIADAVPFAHDNASRIWDKDAACHLHSAFLAADRGFTSFRSLYLGKSSPSHLLWGSFDLAVTRFSGRKAPVHRGGVPNLPDAVTREAYSHEVISAGFWPGGGGMDEAAFYAYSYPTPGGLDEVQVQPDAAYWLEALGEFVLPYAAVALAADPEATLAAFLSSTYDAAARLLDWPGDLTVLKSVIGSPPPPAG